jgi:hypothetical protein
LRVQTPRPLILCVEWRRPSSFDAQTAGVSPVSHPLLAWFHAAADGRHPPADGGVTYVRALDDRREAVVAFTGHAVIASRLGADDLADLSPDGFGDSLAPSVLLRLAGSGSVGVIDATLAARGTGDGTLPLTDRWDDHHRVLRARELRTDVAVHGDERGFVTIGSGIAGRCEMSVEITDALYGSGVGRSLIAEARALVPEGGWLFAAVSPGNARSLRSFLAAGFTPIGSEVLIDPTSRPRHR